ncbi:MAG: sulfite exporter TauE/SafE family protein [Flavobacteriales bacterium]
MSFEGIRIGFLVILPIIAFLYACVGHGGASGYLALMAIFSFAPEVMKPTALLLNLFVAAVAGYHYYKAGYFDKKLFLSFAVASVPMAFLGGVIQIDAYLYKKILGVFLIFAILKILDVFGRGSGEVRSVKAAHGLLVGGLIGFFSGLIGIGGGVILTPVILLLHWGRMKEAAAVSAWFIWVNSAAGLIGQFSGGITLAHGSLLWVGVALIGGFFGSYLGSKRFNNKRLRHLLALVLAIASYKLFTA